MKSPQRIRYELEEGVASFDSDCERLVLLAGRWLTNQSVSQEEFGDALGLVNALFADSYTTPTNPVPYRNTI